MPTLLKALRQSGESSGMALQALREVMLVRVTTVFNARLTVILNALVKVLEEDEDEELRVALDEALRVLLGSTEDPEGLNTLMVLLLRLDKERLGALVISSPSFAKNQTLIRLYRVDWVRQLVSLFDNLQVSAKDELEPLVVPLRRIIEGTGAPGQTVPGFNLLKGVAPTVSIITASLTTGSNEQ
ncbi:hypothetical protein HD554DRAFT_1846523 [Boletus coccyginus]|nr:hypothetical protein HD554DRAFT_1846523 [Boletus coccyginus]